MRRFFLIALTVRLLSLTAAMAQLLLAALFGEIPDRCHRRLGCFGGMALFHLSRHGRLLASASTYARPGMARHRERSIPWRLGNGMGATVPSTLDDRVYGHGNYTFHVARSKKSGHTHQLHGSHYARITILEWSWRRAIPRLVTAVDYPRDISTKSGRSPYRCWAS